MSVFILFVCNIVVCITLIWLSRKYRKLLKDYFRLMEKYRKDTNKYPYFYDNFR